MSDLPLAPGTWQLDPSHSAVTFKVRHLGLTNVRGRFNSFSAVLNVGEDLASTSFDASIDVNSIDTNQPDRDAHLLSTDIFSAESFKTIEFKSSSISGSGGEEYTVDGELTIHGVTKPVTLDVEFNGSEEFAVDGKVHAGFVATTTINRDDFGVDFNMPLGVDQFAFGKRISIELDAQFLAPEG